MGNRLLKKFLKFSYGLKEKKMSIFSKCFKSSPETIERELENLYTKTYHGLTGESLEKSRNDVKNAIKICKERGKKERTDDLPDNFGNLLVVAANEGESKALNIVNRARDDGAKDEDIIEWWNLNDLQRRMVLWSEEVFRYSVFLSAREEGLSADEAAIKVKKIFPMYGNPNNTSNSSGEDRPLSQELRGRIDEYRQKHGALAIQEKTSGHTSYNAFIRAEIKRGAL